MLSRHEVEAAVPFVATLGVRLTEIRPERVVAEIEASQALSTINGGLHGGASMSLGDIAATVCATVNAPENATTTTAQSSAYFLRPVRGAGRAVAQPLRVGRRLIVVEVDVFDADGELCVRMTQSQSVVAGTA